MVETGGSIFIALSLAVMLMSLLPVCILFLRKVAPQAILNVLNLLCLLVFVRFLTLSFLQTGSLFLYYAFRLAEFALSFYLLKLMTPSTRRKDIMNMLLVSLVSVMITIYSLKGVMAYPTAITVIQAGIITVAAFMVLVKLINNRQVTLMDESGFWIAGGLLCYYGMAAFMEMVAACDSGLSQQIQQQKDMVLMGTEIIMLAFFTAAAAVVPMGNKQ